MKSSIVVGFENYIVYENGAVFSIKNSMFLKPLDKGNGYLRLNLYTKGKYVNKYIHRLVAEAKSYIGRKK